MLPAEISSVGVTKPATVQASLPGKLRIEKWLGSNQFQTVYIYI